MAESEKSGVALLVGAGDAIGAAVARRFAAGGYAVCVARRDAEKSRSVVQESPRPADSRAPSLPDVRSEEAVQALFAQVEAELGPVEVCLFNAGANVKSPLIETGAKLFFRVWELACYGGFLTGREAATLYMVLRGRGGISYLPARLRAFAGMRRLPPISPLSASSACAQWPSPWRANLHQRIFMLPILSSMARSTVRRFTGGLAPPPARCR